MFKSLVLVFSEAYLLWNFFLEKYCWKLLIISVEKALSQSAFTCSKLTIEILEQGAKYVQSHTLF